MNHSFPTLPFELLHEIVELLSPTQIREFSRVSQLARAVALPFIFGDLTYHAELTFKIGLIHRARRDVKAVIKKLSLSESREVAGDESVIFHFLESLPNLETFCYTRWSANRFDRPSFSRLVASLQHCPLRDFEFWFSAKSQAHPTLGPSRLRRLIIYPYAVEKTTGATRDQYMHLYKLVQPSFTTLVELKIHFNANAKDVDAVPFDLRRLSPVGATLQSFTYYPAVSDPTLLDTIPEIFPLLSYLDITLLISRTADGNSGLCWKDAYDLSLAKNINLQHLKIYADFRGTHCQFGHWSRGHCLQCTAHRLEATRILALACSKLKRCHWYTYFEPYVFDIIHEFESNERRPVVRSAGSIFL